MKNKFTLIMFLCAMTFWGQQSITIAGSAITQNFTIGTDPNATLPAGFKMTSDWTTGVSATTQVGGTTGSGVLTGTSSGGFYNFADGISPTSTERAIGFLTSSGYAAPRSIMYAFTNNTGSTIVSLSLSWNYEKYRSGSRIFDWTFFHGDTPLASNSEINGDQNYPADANNTTVSNPPASIAKSFVINGVSIPNGSTYYLRWTYTGTGGSTNAQALAIDDFSIILNTVLSNDEFTQTSPLFISTNSDKIEVKLSSAIIEKVVIRDISGKELFTKQGINSSLFEITSLYKTNQVLLVTVEETNGKKQTKKVIF